MTGREPWNGGPGNKRDRMRFRKLTPEQQEKASSRAAQLYDGSRTVAACWSAALDEALPQTRLEPITKTRFAQRFTHGGRSLTPHRECWEATSLDSKWLFERLEQSGTPWAVTYRPEGMSLRWFGTLDAARLYVGGGDAMADVGRILTHTTGEHLAHRDPACLAC